MASDDKRQIVVNVDAGVLMTIEECGVSENEEGRILHLKSCCQHTKALLVDLYGR